MLKHLQAAGLVVVMLAVAACAALNSENFQARLATQYATLKIVDDDPGKAERVVAVASEVQKFANDEAQLTVDLLITAIRSRVPWHSLDAADELLINALLDQLRIELVARLGSDALPDDVRLAVDTVSGWVIEAATVR